MQNKDQLTEDGLTFYLQCAEGEVHEYQCVPHNGSEGLEITVKLTGLAAPIVGRLADAAFSGETVATLTQIAAKPESIQGIDFGAIGSEVGEAVLGDAVKLPDLINDILANTRRDGKPLDRKGNFNEAYRRNYGELLVAVGRVVAFNRFLPLSAISAIGAQK